MPFKNNIWEVRRVSDNMTGFAALKKYFPLMLIKINEFPSFSHDLKS